MMMAAGRGADSLVAQAHVSEVEAAARAVAEHHHAHAVGHGVARQALEPAGSGGRRQRRQGQRSAAPLAQAAGGLEGRRGTAAGAGS